MSLILTVLLAPAAGAESPTLVSEDLLVDGVYIAPERTDIDPTGLPEVVRQARARGLRLVIVVPIDAQPDTAAFARRVQEAADADAAIVFGVEGAVEASVVSEFESARLRAVAAARSKATPVGAAESFTEELLTEPSRSVPPIIGQTITAVVGLAVILAVVVAFEQWLRRLRRGRRLREHGYVERVESAA